jgi:hypothetical protein
MTIRYPISNLNNGLLNGVAGAIGSWNVPISTGPSGPNFVPRPIKFQNMSSDSTNDLTTNFQKITGINVPIELEITVNTGTFTTLYVNRQPTILGAHAVTGAASLRIVVQPDMFIAVRQLFASSALRTYTVYNFSDLRTRLDSFTLEYVFSP